MKKNQCFQICSPHIQSIDFLSSNADLIVFSDYNETASLYSTKSSTIVWTKDFAIFRLDVSPIDTKVAGGVKECLLVIDAANGETIFSVDVGDWIRCVLFLSPQKIACGLGYGKVAIVCCQTQTIEKILNATRGDVSALAISPLNCDILLTGNWRGRIEQTIISSEKTVMVYEGHNDAVFDLKFLSCGSMFVSGSGDQTARLFALDRKQAIRVFKGHSDCVRSVFLIHDDELLITASFDNTVKVWKIESGECLSTVKSEQDVYCVAVSKDEQSLVVGGLDGKVTMFSCPPRFSVSPDRTLNLC